MGIPCWGRASFPGSISDFRLMAAGRALLHVELVIEDGPQGLKEQVGDDEQTTGRYGLRSATECETPGAIPRSRRLLLTKRRYGQSTYVSVTWPSKAACLAPVVEGMFPGTFRQRQCASR